MPLMSAHLSYGAKRILNKTMKQVWLNDELCLASNGTCEISSYVDSGTRA
jgi:hypothetical protein